MVNASPEQHKEIAGAVKSTIQQHEYDITIRNQRINEIDRALYSDGLFEGLDFPNGHDRTLYNWVARVVDVHTAQLMGRPFKVLSSYDKEDLSQFKDDPNDPTAAQQKDEAEFINKRRKIQADARMELIRAMVEDNGGPAIFKRGARIGSSSGFTVLKEWFDKDEKKTNIKVVESVTNYRAGWSSNDFRERDWDAYVWQISPMQARRQYGQYLQKDNDFEITSYGSPWNLFDSSAQVTTDVLNRDVSQVSANQPRPSVTVIDFTGFIEGYAPQGGTLVKVAKGSEKKFNALVVGGCIVQLVSDENLMPDYYIIPNREEPRRPWGSADVSSSAIQINRSYIEAMSDWRTISNKLLFPLIMGKGFETGSIPRKQQRKITVVPMSPEQNLEVLQLPGEFGTEYARYIDELKENFVRVTGIGRVLFDDPTVTTNSNQALITTLKGVIDIVEDKQDRWNVALQSMFKRALEKAAAFIPDIKAVVETDDNWYLYTEWPSVLRHDDATYQQMLLNWWNAGVYSYDTLLEKLGVRDASEEIDRMRDNLNDPVMAAIVAHQTAMLADWTINKAKGIPPWGYIVPKVQLRGDLTPQQEANMADNYGWNEGQYGSSIGPQGNAGTVANDNFINAGQINGDAYSGGMPAHAQPSPGPSPQQTPAPTLTPDQNTGKAASMPGSGAPAVSPQGAINQNNQQRGR